MAASSTIYSDMSAITGKHTQRYVDNLQDRSKLTCIIHGPGNSQDEYKLLGDFGTKYAKVRPTKDLRQEHETKKSL